MLRQSKYLCKRSHNESRVIVRLKTKLCKLGKELSGHLSYLSIAFGTGNIRRFDFHCDGEQDLRTVDPFLEIPLAAANGLR